MAEIFAQQQNIQMKTISQHTISTEGIARILDENSRLIVAICEKQGTALEIVELEKRLHRNLVYLTRLAYPNRPLNEILRLLPSRELNPIQESEQSRLVHQVSQNCIQTEATSSLLPASNPYQQHTPGEVLNQPNHDSTVNFQSTYFY